MIHKRHTLIHRIVLTLLLLFGLMMTIWFVFRGQDAFTILSYEHTKEADITVKSTEKSVTLAGHFQARADNLGAFAFRLNNAATFVSNRAQFQIKERGAKDWYYTHTLAVSGPNFRPSFPFGFPLIPDSRGKTYEFQLTIHDTDAFSLQNKDQMHFTLIASKYQYPFGQLRTDKMQLFEFVITKVLNIVTSANFLGFILISFLPTLFYVMWKVIRSPAFMLSLLFAGIIAYEVLWMDGVYDFYYAVTLVVWIVYCVLYHLDERISYAGSIIHLVLLPIPLIMNDILRAEKVATWAYVFFCAGICMMILNQFVIKEKKTVPIRRLRLR